MNKLGEYIRAQRIRANLTCRELGEAVGKSRQQISQVELGKNSINIYDLFVICKYLRCSYRTAMQFMGEDVRAAMERKQAECFRPQSKRRQSE